MHLKSNSTDSAFEWVAIPENCAEYIGISVNKQLNMRVYCKVMAQWVNMMRSSQSFLPLLAEWVIGVLYYCAWFHVCILKNYKNLDVKFRCL